MPTPTEEWRPVVGHEGAYEVSNLGNVRNRAGRVLSPNRMRHGYLCVHLYSGSRDSRKVRTIHRLVAEAFLTDGFGKCVNHLDGDKTNNRVSNLEWATSSENAAHAHEIGLLKIPRKAVVGRPVNGGDVLVFDSQSAAERHFAGRNTSRIHQCLVGKCRTAYGYTWGLQ